jgi:hypothetical protein
LPPPPEKAQASRPSRARPAQRVITRRPGRARYPQTVAPAWLVPR